MKGLTLIPLLLIAACSKGADPAPTATPALDQPTALVSEAAAAATSPAPPTAPVSRYTSFDQCTLKKSNENEDWSVSRCAGQGGYRLELDYGDAREDLMLLRGGRVLSRLNLIGLGSGGFNALGKTAEWRGVEGPDGFEPAWLIVRNNLSEDMANSEHVTSILVVIDLKQACVVAQVRPQAGQNEAARAITDGGARPCLRK